METRYLKENELEIAAQIIKNGGTVIFPTETVYGLGANALDSAAVAKIFCAKGRPQDNPLIVHLADISQLTQVAKEIPEKAYKLFKAYSPGPLTVILKRSEAVPASVSAGLDTVALRIPSNKIAHELIQLAGPIAAPSANISGRPSPTSFSHVKDEMRGRVDAIIESGDSEVGLESTVVSLVEEPPVLLRPGKITHKQLEAVVGKVELSKSIFSKFESGVPASPGMKYRHYAPKAKLILVRGFDEDARKYIHSKIKGNQKYGVLCFDGEQQYFSQAAAVKAYGNPSQPETLAHNLFDSLLYFDSKDVDIIFARVSDGDGIEMAVYNRLIKAAGFNVIEV